MQIECKLKREGGTHVELRGTKYHFAPGADGAHVADVSDDDHIALLLAIPEGYKIYRPADVAKEQRPVEAKQPDPADTNGDGAVDAGEELTYLREQFKAKYGKPPHHAMKADSIRAKL